MNRVVWPGRSGPFTSTLSDLTQNSTSIPILIGAQYADGTPIDLSGTVMSATFRFKGQTGSYPITGELLPGVGSFTWQPSESDVAVSGEVLYQFAFTGGDGYWFSFEAPVTIFETQSGGGAVPIPGHVGVSPAQSAFLELSETAGNTAVSGNLVKWTVNGTLADSGVLTDNVIAVPKPNPGENIGFSPVWDGSTYHLAQQTVQTYAVLSLPTPIVLPPNFETSLTLLLLDQYGEGGITIHDGGMSDTLLIRQPGLYNIAVRTLIDGILASSGAVWLRLRKNSVLVTDLGVNLDQDVRACIVGLPITSQVVGLGVYLETGDTVRATIQHTSATPLTAYVLRASIRRAGQIL